MAITLAQGPFTNTTVGTSLSVGSGQGWATPASGNLILVAAGLATSSGGGVLSISGFTLVAQQGADNAARHVRVFGKISNGTESTVTLTSTVSNALGLAVYEFSGATLTEDVAEVGVNSDTAVTSLASGNIVTGTNDVLLFSGVMLANTPTAWSAWTNSFIGSTGNIRIGSAYRIVSASGTYSTTASWTTARAGRLTLAALQASAVSSALTGKTSAASSASASLTVTGGSAVTRNAATDAELVTALQASASGDSIKLTVTRDYTVSVAGVDCRPAGVSVSNATGINARIKTGSTTTTGFRDCFGINFAGIRFGTTKFWGGGFVNISNSPLAAGLYFQGNHTDSTVTGSTFTTSGFGITLDGRRSGTNGYVSNFTISGNTFTQIGVDPIRGFGLRNCTISNNTISDVSSYRYSNDQTANRLHSDGMDLTQVDGLTISGNTIDLVEWQGIILKNHGYLFGWPEHFMRNVVIENNTFSRIGFANFPEIGTGGAGVGIYIQDCETVTVKNNIDNGNITRAALNWFHLWPSEAALDPAYGTYSAATDSITYIKTMKVFYGNNSFIKTLATPPSGAWQSSDGPPLLPLSTGDTPVQGKAQASSSASASLTPGNLPLSGSANVSVSGLASITPPGEGILIRGSAETASSASGTLFGGHTLISASAASALHASGTLTSPAAQLYFTPPTTSGAGFSTPYSTSPASRLFRHYGAQLVGVTVLKENGVYIQVQSPTAARLQSATEVYLGGHRYPVSTTVSNALIAAGFTTSI